MMTYFCMIATAAIVIVSVFSFELVNLLTTKKEYLHASEAVPVLCYAFLFSGLFSFASTGIRLSGKTYYLTIVMTIAACINLPSNYYLVGMNGYMGAAYALFITFFVTTILSYLISSKLYFIKYEIGRILLILAISLVIVVSSKELRLASGTHDFLFRVLLVTSYFVTLYYIGFSGKERHRMKKRIGKKVSGWIAN